MAIAVNEAKCIGCGWCVLICSEEALQVVSTFVVKIAEGRCSACLKCIDVCPNDALEEK